LRSTFTSLVRGAHEKSIVQSRVVGEGEIEQNS
jgi:hypothetical protein